MARTALTVTDLARGAASADLPAEDADETNGDIVETGTISDLLIRLENTGGSAATYTIAQADRGDGSGGGPGDLEVALAAGDIKYLAGLDEARFEQQAGAESGEARGLYGDAGGAGAADVEVLVVRLPRGS